VELSIDIERWNHPNNLPVEDVGYALILLVPGEELIYEAQEVAAWLLFTWMDTREQHHFFVLSVFARTGVDFVEGDIAALFGFPDASFADNTFVLPQPAVCALVNLWLRDKDPGRRVVDRFPSRILTWSDPSLQECREE
jgi:hypothetical protein